MTTQDPMNLHVLADRMSITDVLYRYASCIDMWDPDGLRQVLADDVSVTLGNAAPVIGSANVIQAMWERNHTALWQHHLLSVYHVDVDGDSAKALVYHTSHQVFSEEPETVRVLVGRYRDDLARDPTGWRITKLVLELLWGERRQDTDGYLRRVGGRGPLQAKGENA